MEQKKVIGTELLQGQGLGNQLFCYVTARCLALKNEAEFTILNPEILANNIHSQKGMYFMDIDCGLPMEKTAFAVQYQEAEDRVYFGNSEHDLTHGCYIAGADEKLFHLEQSTLLYGNLQDQSYFREYKEEIKKWFSVKPEFDHKEYAKENLCIINIRGGEYAGEASLFLRRKYWLDAMKWMKKERSDMEFMVITDDVVAAQRILPEVKAIHLDLAGDYTVIKNASYLILSNSSFAFFPAYTSEVAKKIIAPKYWARHNVSDGYWASEQNIYDEFLYMDRRGRLFTADTCRKELKQYYARHHKLLQRKRKPSKGIILLGCRVKSRWIRFRFMAGRMMMSIKKRSNKIMHRE